MKLENSLWLQMHPELYTVSLCQFLDEPHTEYFKTFLHILLPYSPANKFSYEKKIVIGPT